MSEISLEVTPLDIMFKAYCNMDSISKTRNLELLPLSQCDIWFQSAQVLDPIHVTSTDIGLCFFKFHKRAINYQEFLKLLDDFTRTKRLDMNAVMYKLQTSVRPDVKNSKE